MSRMQDISMWSVIFTFYDQFSEILITFPLIWQEVTGPAESPFEGGKFKLELFLPEDYPMSAPKVEIFWMNC